MIPTAIPSAPAPARRTTGSTFALVIGLALQAVAAVFVAASGLLMPLWAVVALWLVWLAGLAVQLRHRHRPIVVIAAPVVVAALWVLTGTLGETFLGWTA